MTKSSGMESLDSLAAMITDNPLDIYKKQMHRKGILKSRKYADVLNYLLSIADKKDFEVKITNIEDPLFKSDVIYVLEKIVDSFNDTKRIFQFNLNNFVKLCDELPRLNPGGEVLF